MESISWSDRDVSSDRGTTTTVEKTPRMPGPEASPVTTQRGNSTSPTLADAFSTLLLKLVEIGSAAAKSELRKRCPRKHQTPMNKIAPAAQTPPATSNNEALPRSEEHTSELQSLRHLVCRLL